MSTYLFNVRPINKQISNISTLPITTNGHINIPTTRQCSPKLPQNYLRPVSDDLGKIKIAVQDCFPIHAIEAGQLSYHLESNKQRQKNTLLTNDKITRHVYIFIFTMITLPTLLSLPIWLSSALIVHAFASPSEGFIDSTLADDNFDSAISLTGGESCTYKQIKQIKSGFHEMSVLFASAQSPDFSQQAERDFFGQPDRITDYTSLIKENLVRAALYANAKGNRTHMPDIHVRCDDPNDVCEVGNREDGRHAMYNIAHGPHFNFCDDYFELPALDDKIGRDTGDNQQQLNLMHYYNRGT